ncbi:hypothetical protein Ami103574_02555 [Aminipila butyrica]|uniref:Uncharacterized protein n=1 Tax=Aminipila butyrica TaxID=433296 RepID=A0A858BQV4_9FIRM|nr:hypothetical protein [Aminipila butyrica]QIB68261.1 hypothetical protein Ami103574_02555 [Aminipila butyrica]
MLITKGGISREIDEKNLQPYLDKGYEVVKETEGPGEEQRRPAKPKKG